MYDILMNISDKLDETSECRTLANLHDFNSDCHNSSNSTTAAENTLIKKCTDYVLDF